MTHLVNRVVGLISAAVRMEAASISVIGVSNAHFATFVCCCSNTWYSSPWYLTMLLCTRTTLSGSFGLPRAQKLFLSPVWACCLLNCLVLVVVGKRSLIRMSMVPELISPLEPHCRAHFSCAAHRSCVSALFWHVDSRIEKVVDLSLLLTHFSHSWYLAISTTLPGSFQLLRS